MREALRGEALGKALVAPVTPGDMLTAAVCVARFDLGTMAPDDADFTASFELQSTAEQVKESPCTSTLLGGLCDCQLACRASRRNTAAGCAPGAIATSVFWVVTTSDAVASAVCAFGSPPHHCKPR